MSAATHKSDTLNFATTSNNMVLLKADLESQLFEEVRDIKDGKLKEDSPLDFSAPFEKLCQACRTGDLKACQILIHDGVNVNAKDQFDYTPLILASLCGHYEVVQLLLESGALCERDTFQGERCLYNALNQRIRNLLIRYDYSKAADPLQPLASHISSLLNLDQPKVADVTVTCSDRVLQLHRFLLSARSPYFQKKLAKSPSSQLKLPPTLPSKAFELIVRYLYLGETSIEGPDSDASDLEVLAGVDRLSTHLEIPKLFDSLLEAGDRRLARQRKQEEVEKARNQLEAWFKGNVLKYKIEIDTNKVEEIRWDKSNAIFADVLLAAEKTDDGPERREEVGARSFAATNGTSKIQNSSIPVGPRGEDFDKGPYADGEATRSVLFPAHKAMLIRSDLFRTMFSSAFKEAQATQYLQVIPVDCSPEVLEVVLTYLYTEKTDMPLELAVDVLFTADLMFLDKLKTKAAVVIDTMGDSKKQAQVNTADTEMDIINVYDVLRAGWFTNMDRLEKFAARYLANRLERFIDGEEFAEVVKESAARIQNRQETDTIELVDDIRSYLDERFRLRFQDSGIAELVESSRRPRKEGEIEAEEAIEAEAHVSEDEAPDEFSQEAIQYEMLQEKLDLVLEKLHLDA